MTTTRKFPDRLILDEVGHQRGSVIFSVCQPFHFHSATHGTVLVPAGFLTDGYSVPRIFWPIFQPYGQALGPAVVHDFLYTRASLKGYSHLNRREVDAIFLEGMLDRGVAWLDRTLIHRAVRIGGWRAFRKV